MAYVPVPKDLSKVKTKVAFNLTKRQLICFSSAAIVGIPIYLATRGTIGTDVAVLLMIGIMLPFFFIAIYEKDGQPAEKILRNVIRSRFYWPKVRPYKTQNLYVYLIKEAERFEKANKNTNATRKTSARGKKTGGKKQVRT